MSRKRTPDAPTKAWPYGKRRVADRPIGDDPLPPRRLRALPGEPSRPRRFRMPVPPFDPRADHKARGDRDHYLRALSVAARLLEAVPTDLPGARARLYALRRTVFGALGVPHDATLIQTEIAYYWCAAGQHVLRREVLTPAQPQMHGTCGGCGEVTLQHLIPDLDPRNAASA